MFGGSKLAQKIIELYPQICAEKDNKKSAVTPVPVSYDFMDVDSGGSQAAGTALGKSGWWSLSAYEPPFFEIKQKSLHPQQGRRVSSAVPPGLPAQRPPATLVCDNGQSRR